MDEIIDYIKERMEWHNEDIKNSQKAMRDNPNDNIILSNCIDIIKDCLVRQSECSAIIEKIKQIKNDGE